MPTKHLLIKGKVQGVFFRATAKEIADTLPITGWIKNTDEGHVEAMISGSEEAVKRFFDWCKRGPQRAVVTSVEMKDAPAENVFSEFKIVRRS